MPPSARRARAKPWRASSGRARGVLRSTRAALDSSACLGVLADPSGLRSPARSLQRLEDRVERLVLRRPVGLATERWETGAHGGIVPPPGDPARHVHDAQRAEWLAE